MSDINVALTTTKHIVVSDKPVPGLKETNTPICTANMGMGMFGFSSDLEREESNLANICFKMAKQVFIDSEKKYVFIGKDPQDPETALVEYTEEDSHIYAEEFFKQWDTLRTMLFEFTLFDMEGNARFTIKGLWDNDKWFSLEIRTKPSLTILKSPLPPWGTFSSHEHIGKGG